MGGTTGAFVQAQLQIPTDPQAILDQYGPALIDFAVTVVTFLVAFVVVYAILRPLLVRLTRGVLDARGFDETVLGLAGNAAGAIALIGSLAIAATVAGFGTFLAAFATLAGALALALGFAAQDLISNFVSGVFILRDKPFEVGDWIEWNDTSGVVQEIKLRVTKLKTFDNEIITVPNSELADNAVKNPVTEGRLRMSLPFGIGYEDDIDQARDVLVQEAATVDGVLNDPEPSVILTELGDSAVVLTSRVWIDEADRGRYVSVRSEYFQAVKERFDAEGLDMPYPYTELTGGIEVADAQQIEAAETDD